MKHESGFERKPTLDEIARALGGEISAGQVCAPGPGHSARDRSLSVALSESDPAGYVVHSFAGDDPIMCKDYVREKLGLPQWRPGNGKGTVMIMIRLLRATSIAPQTANPICAFSERPQRNSGSSTQTARAGRGAHRAGRGFPIDCLNCSPLILQFRSMLSRVKRTPTD